MGRLAVAVIALAMLLVALPARGQFIINPTWDSSVTSLSNAAQFESGFTAAIHEFETLFVNNTKPQ
jgi:hypothetical protein